MEYKIRIVIFCFLVIHLQGCKSPDLPTNEIVLSEKKQEAYLSHAKPAKHFGFKVFPVINNQIGMKGSARLHPNHRAIVPMVSESLPVIEIAGRNYRDPSFALIDTGSPNSWMEFAYSQTINTDFLSFRDRYFPYTGKYSTGGVPAYGAIAYQIRISQLFIEDMPVYIRMAAGSLGPLARNIETPKIRSVLGYDLLRLFSYVQFNFINRTVDFETMKPFIPNEQWVLGKANIINEPGEGLVLDGALFDKNMPMVLDLAGDYHLAHENADSTLARQVSIGELVFRQVPQTKLPENTTTRLGKELFSDLIVTICPLDNTVYFEKPN